MEALIPNQLNIYRKGKLRWLNFPGTAPTSAGRINYTLAAKDCPSLSVFGTAVSNVNSIVYLSYIVIAHTGIMDVSYIRAYPGGVKLTSGTLYGSIVYFTG